MTYCLTPEQRAKWAESLDQNRAYPKSEYIQMLRPTRKAFPTRTAEQRVTWPPLGSSLLISGHEVLPLSVPWMEDWEDLRVPA